MSHPFFRSPTKVEASQTKTVDKYLGVKVDDVLGEADALAYPVALGPSD
jgi:hypothetical protein